MDEYFFEWVVIIIIIATPILIGAIVCEIPHILDTEVVKEYIKGKGKNEEIKNLLLEYRKQLLYIDRRCDQLEKRVRELEDEDN